MYLSKDSFNGKFQAKNMTETHLGIYWKIRCSFIASFFCLFAYTLSRGNAVVVEYRRDPATDMFQVWIIYEFDFVNTLASFFLNLF